MRQESVTINNYLDGLQSTAQSGTFGVMGGVYGLEVEGFVPATSDDQRARADWIGPNYFQTAGMTLAAGREFSATDHNRARRVVIVNQTMARFYFGQHSPIGRRVTFNKNDYDIVGVVADAKYTDLRESTPRMIYFALLQGVGSVNIIEVRASGNASTIASTVSTIIPGVDPRLRAAEISSIVDRVEQNLARDHLVADLTAFFGVLTLVLAAVGIYGTLAYTASRRAREIGVRLALGSERTAVVWLVMRDVWWRLAASVLLGAAASVAVGRLLDALLFGVRAADPAVIGTVAAILMTVGLGAGYLPAARASRLDPSVVLRA